MSPVKGLLLPAWDGMESILLDPSLQKSKNKLGFFA